MTMKQHIVLRAIKLADYIMQTKATVRDASKVYGVSKSTVHKELSHLDEKHSFNLYCIEKKKASTLLLLSELNQNL